MKREGRIEMCPGGRQDAQSESHIWPSSSPSCFSSDLTSALPFATRPLIGRLKEGRKSLEAACGGCLLHGSPLSSLSLSMLRGAAWEKRKPLVFAVAMRWSAAVGTAREGGGRDSDRKRHRRSPSFLRSPLGESSSLE